MVAPTEKVIEQKFVRECVKRGWLCLKQNVMGRRGYPDRLVIKPGGIHVWIEMKRPGGKLSDLQKVTIANLEAQGCVVSVQFDAMEAINFMEGIE